MESKTKDKGNVKKSKIIIARGIQILNGENSFRFNFIPINLLNYEAPQNADEFAKGERYAIWIKLEDAKHKAIQDQLKKDLREFTIWFDEENLKQLKDFINK